MKTIYLSIIAIFIFVNGISQSIPPVDSCALYVNGKTHYYGVWPGCKSTYTSCNNGCLYKPVILLNGFDPDSHRCLYYPDDDCLTEDGLTFERCIYCVANEHGMAESLRSAGYDIIILDFADLDVIRKQADVLQALIVDLKQKMQACNNQHEFVVIGPSSGGLVARYALAEMEEDDINHNTRLYISFDAPHRGANVPLSLQALVRNLNNTLNAGNWIEFIGSLYSIIMENATQELLVYHINKINVLSANSSDTFDEFYTSLNNLNQTGYPLKSRNVAISNGSSVSTNQGFAAGDKLYKLKVTTVLFNIYHHGFAVPDHFFKKIYSSNSMIATMPVNIGFVAVNNTDPIDNAPGGKANFISQLANNTFGFTECAANDCDEQFECFIPTISSLDLRNTDDYFYNVKSNITGNDDLAFKGIDYNDDVSPFDAICISEENEWHVINGVTDLNAGFVEDEIMPEKYYLQNQTVSKCTDYSSLDYIKMGSDVTYRKPQGEFVFSPNSGTSDVVARNRVVMESGSKLEPSGNAKIHLYTDMFSNCSFVSNRSFPEVSGISDSDDMNVDDNNLKLINQNNLIDVYPNPFQNSFKVEINPDFGKDIQLQVIDMQGNILKSENMVLPDNESVFLTEISAQNLKHGLYILQLISESKIETVKIIKQ
ncbi:MAG: T9SS type A sorting domain-containing protein [Bacteroidales bacterium]|nr:T9SS type A sorting domain-containing protein [Bacteroidales bacterium]MDD3860051.1 T9SS type A sorting domain-containing protein [Bacteroidales bacterium]